MCIHSVTFSELQVLLYVIFSPFTLEYNVKPYLNASVAFSLNKPATPACNQSSLVWGTLTNNDVKVCGNFQNQDPTFEYVSKDFLIFYKGVNDFSRRE